MRGHWGIPVIASILLLGSIPFDSSFATDGSLHEFKKLSGSGFSSFGISVSKSGDTVIVGSSGDNPSGTNSGSASIFQKDQGGADNWGEVKKLTASDGATQDRFGWSVSISGDIAVVGAFQNDDVPNNSGSVYIFYRNNGGADNWGEVKKLTASDAAASDEFGE